MESNKRPHSPDPIPPRTPSSSSSQPRPAASPTSLPSSSSSAAPKSVPTTPTRQHIPLPPRPGGKNSPPLPAVNPMIKHPLPPHAPSTIPPGSVTSSIPAPVMRHMPTARPQPFAYSPQSFLPPLSALNVSPTTISKVISVIPPAPPSPATTSGTKTGGGTARPVVSTSPKGTQNGTGAGSGNGTGTGSGSGGVGPVASGSAITAEGTANATSGGTAAVAGSLAGPAKRQRTDEGPRDVPSEPRQLPQLPGRPESPAQLYYFKRKSSPISSAPLYCFLSNSGVAVLIGSAGGDAIFDKKSDSSSTRASRSPPHSSQIAGSAGYSNGGRGRASFSGQGAEPASLTRRPSDTTSVSVSSALTPTDSQPTAVATSGQSASSSAPSSQSTSTPSTSSTTALPFEQPPAKTGRATFNYPGPGAPAISFDASSSSRFIPGWSPKSKVPRPPGATSDFSAGVTKPASGPSASGGGPNPVVSLAPAPPPSIGPPAIAPRPPSSAASPFVSSSAASTPTLIAPAPAVTAPTTQAPASPTPTPFGVAPAAYIPPAFSAYPPQAYYPTLATLAHRPSASTQPASAGATPPQAQQAPVATALGPSSQGVFHPATAPQRTLAPRIPTLTTAALPTSTSSRQAGMEKAREEAKRRRKPGDVVVVNDARLLKTPNGVQEQYLGRCGGP
ncbi:hypothetical protein BDK51DRAFT_41425, partial [Blyttiomyces helicus]